MGAPPVPEATPAVLIRDSRGADSQYSAVLMRANTQIRTYLANLDYRIVKDCRHSRCYDVELLV